MKLNPAGIFQTLRVWIRKSSFRIVAAALVVSVLPLSLFLVTAHELFLHQVSKRVSAQTYLGAVAIGDSLEESVNKEGDLLRSLGSRPLLLQAWEQGDIQEVSKNLQLARSYAPKLIRLSLYGPNREIVTCDPEGCDELGSGLGKSFKKATRTTSLTSVFQAGASKTWLVEIVVPITDPQGTLRGFLAGEFPTTFIVDSVRLSQLQTRVAYVDPDGNLIEKHGNSVYVVQKPSDLRGYFGSNAGAANRFAAASQSSFTMSQVKNSSLGWSVVVAVPQAAIRAGTWEYERGLALLALLVLVLAMGAGAFIAAIYTQLGDAERQISVILDKANDAFIAMNEMGIILRWNRMAETLFGWPCEQAIGKRVDELIIPVRLRDSHRTGLARFLSGSEGNKIDRRFEVPGLHRNGHEFPVEISLSANINKGKYVFAAFLRDISEQKQNQERSEAYQRGLELRNREIESANRMKSRFLAAMSHELRTPLNAVLGFASLLLEDESFAGKQRRWLEHIRDGGRHLLQLINDLLDLSRIEAGKFELSRTSFAPHTVINEVTNDIEPLLAKKKIQLSVRVEQRLIIDADRLRFKQILYNLLSNAVKFTPQAGSITIIVERSDGQALVSIADSGIGISPEQHASIFEEFKQIADSDSEVHNGTGLGLAITKKLVEQHGGWISVDSEVGRGSVFRFTIPLSAGAPSMSLVPEPSEAASTISSPTVLIIDDDAMAIELLSRIIQSAGYSVEVARSKEEALEKAKHVEVAAVTLDVLFPGTDGFSILQALKSTPELSEIPVIVVSVVDKKSVAFALGAVDYILKPVDQALLTAALQKHVPRSADCRPTVLAVDDDGTTLELIESILNSQSYETITTTDGKTALEILSKRSVHAIILDLLMPGMDGFEVLDHLRTGDFVDVPLFILTGHVLSPDQRAKLLSHSAHILEKNRAWDKELVAQIERITRKS